LYSKGEAERGFERILEALELQPGQVIWRIKLGAMFME